MIYKEGGREGGSALANILLPEKLNYLSAVEWIPGATGSGQSFETFAGKVFLQQREHGWQLSQGWRDSTDMNAAFQTLRTKMVKSLHAQIDSEGSASSFSLCHVGCTPIFNSEASRSPFSVHEDTEMWYMQVTCNQLSYQLRGRGASIIGKTVALETPTYSAAKLAEDQRKLNFWSNLYSQIMCAVKDSRAQFTINTTGIRGHLLPARQLCSVINESSVPKWIGRGMEERERVADYLFGDYLTQIFD